VIPELPGLESRAFLVARHLVLGAGIFVVTAGAPLAIAAGRFPAAFEERFALGLRRFPEPAPNEPSHRRVGLRALQLFERRQQIFLPGRAEGGRRRAGDDHPEPVMTRHWNLSDARGASAFR
jgi:hypothetical protein